MYRKSVDVESGLVRMTMGIEFWSASEKLPLVKKGGVNLAPLILHKYQVASSSTSNKGFTTKSHSTRKEECNRIRAGKREW